LPFVDALAQRDRRYAPRVDRKRGIQPLPGRRPIAAVDRNPSVNQVLLKSLPGLTAVHDGRGARGVPRTRGN
jgi:hypothetical protein